MGGHNNEVVWSRVLHIHTLLPLLAIFIPVVHCQGGLTQQFSVYEEQPAGTVIASVGLQGAPPPYDGPFYQTPGAEEVFDFNERGMLSIRGRLDRETRSMYRFLVKSRVGGRDVVVTINVLDINDNTPTFPVDFVAKHLVESTPLGAKLVLGSAVDPDLGLNSTHHYEIVSGNTGDAFRLGTKVASNGLLFLDLAVNRELDYETTPTYNLVIAAYDGGVPPRVGTLRVNVTIGDANDNQPTFNQSRYFARVPENAAIGRSVLQVCATDRDGGENGRVRYHIDRHRSDPLSHFSVDAVTGEINIQRHLDYETQESYDLVVVASDNGTQRLQTSAVVSVSVTDVNDNAPVIDIRFVTADGSPRVSEDLGVGDPVVRVSVSDADVKSGHAGVNITLTAHDGHFALTTRDSTVYLIVVSSPLSSGTTYRLTVAATDSGQPPLTAVRSLSIYSGMPDTGARPQFTLQSYYAHVQGGWSGLIIQVEARGGDPRYYIQPASQIFVVDNRTGVISTRDRLSCDRQVMSLVVVAVTTTEVPQLTASATVMVDVRGVSMNRPVFEKSFYEVTVDESRPVNSCIIKVTAVDADCDQTLAYTLQQDGTSQHAFHIDENSGEVCLTQTLDYETTTVYNVLVVATDPDGLQGKAFLQVIVRNVNDGQPIFTASLYSVTLPPGVGMGTEVAMVAATDTDSDTFGEVRYHFTDENQRDFNIDSESGIISWTSSVSPKTTQSLFVTASDLGGSRAEKNTRVDVNVAEAGWLVFMKPVFRFVVKESARVGDLVGTVRLQQSAANAYYSFVSSAFEPYFSLDGATGKIRVLRSLDYTTTPSFLLAVRVRRETDRDDNVGSMAQVYISVTEEASYPLKFRSEHVEVSVREDVGVSTVIAAVSVAETNKPVSYSLDEKSRQRFAIDSASGRISLRRALDFEETQRYRVVVTAADDDADEQSSATVTVTVLDANDNAPVFSRTRYVVSVNATSRITTRLFKVSATDRDRGNNGKVSYFLQGGMMSDDLRIVASDGSVYARRALNRDHYEALVVAVDDGVPALSSTVTVSIAVKASGQSFEGERLTLHVEENHPPHTSVGVVTAAGRRDDATRYSLAAPNEVFRLDEHSGEIVTLGRLDRETTDRYEFNVIVSSGSSSSEGSTIHVEVHVEDVNDNAPRFDRQGGRYVSVVRENRPAGTLVTQLSARDPDRGNNATVTFHLDTESADASRFAVDAVSGRVTTREPLDREAQSLYVLRVVARDSGQPPRSQATAVEVKVEDENEAPPQFPAARVSFSVRENSPPGAIVGRVTAIDMDAGENGRVLYHIVGGNALGSFGVNMTTGDVYVARKLDFEEWPAYVLHVRATDRSATYPLSSLQDVAVTVVDINDNAPVFHDVDPVVLHVREDVPVSGVIHQMAASDADSGDNGVIVYSIVFQSPGDYFRIDAASGMLSLSTSLDYEHTQKITLTIRADNGQGAPSSMTSAITVIILVQDVNDNAPVFQTRSRVHVMEDEPIGYPVLHVIAVDKDSGDNGRISYALVNSDDHFNLDSDTGLMTITKSLDRETTDVFHLNVSASDHGQQSVTTFMQLDVHVIDVNDNAPAFERSVYAVNVSENMAVDSVVEMIHATDLDTGVNAKLRYLIPRGIAKDKFVVDVESGAITLNAPLDRETQASWVITAYVKDSAFPALYDTTTILVNVADENDNAPVFRNSVYRIEIPENVDLSQQAVHSVMASDADDGDNGRVSYVIVGGNEAGEFSLDDRVGRLSCRALDREHTSSYELLIEARDGGTPRRTATTRVLVSVLDENDSDPTFEKSRYTARVAEDTPVGQSLLTVRATDRDAGDNARVHYTVMNDASGRFHVDNTTGVISSARAFDREQTASYSFTIVAMDSGHYGPRSDSVRVDVEITDVNDNAPVFTEIPYRVEMSSGHEVGQPVTTVTAVDADDNANGQVVYSLLRKDALFRVDAMSGVVRTKRSVNLDPPETYSLKVVARDRADVPRSSTGVLEISVGTGSDPPHVGMLRFTNQTYTAFVRENAARDTSVIRVATRFSGSVAATSHVTYGFASGNDEQTFSIHRSSGEIRVNDPTALDYERTQRIRLIVMATTSSPPIAYAYATVWLNLIDVNDNAPMFSADRYKTAVWEGKVPGTYVTQVMAVDADSVAANGNLTYRIVGGNTHNAFVIDPPRSGIVKTNLVLNREMLDTFRLRVEARDAGVPPRSATCLLRVEIVDVNDNAPFFPDFALTDVDVREGSELGSVIRQITATDVDLDMQLSYGFAPRGGDGDGAFSIDRYSGKISVAKPLDYEQRSKYVLKVQASDQKHKITRDLVVNVLDSNDNPPVFSQQSYQVTVAELTGRRVPIITVNATDRDSGENARLTYSMLWVTGFYIDSHTGTIYTNQTVVFQVSQPTIHLVVTCHDHGEPSLSTVVAVRVQVIDINNHAPVFALNAYRVSVSEDATAGATLLQVSATDADDSYENTKIDYSIVSGNSAGAFEVATATGDLILVESLDREATSSYTLVVRAADRGTPALSSTVVVTVTVSDVNDNAPRFVKRDVTVGVNESVSVGVVITYVSATDRDIGDNGVIRYELASGNEDGAFALDDHSGALRVRRRLDCETLAQHRLVVRAEDSGRSGAKSAFATITVNVYDVNEFSPRFPVMMYLETIRAGQPTGTAVFTAYAMDRDADRFGRIRYQLNGGTDAFAINPHTGIVTTTTVMRGGATYEFRVSAIDAGGLEASVPVLVTAEDRAPAPLFDRPRYNFDLRGDAKIGDVVGVVRASSELPVVYRLREKPKYFAINESYGAITVIADLRRAVEASRRKRDVSKQERDVTQSDTSQEKVQLEVIASVDSAETSVNIAINIDRSCAGCAVLASSGTGSKLAGTPLVLLIVFVVVAIVLAVVIAVMYIRGRDRKRRPTDASACNSSFDTLPPPLGNEPGPPAYNDAYPPRGVALTTSDVSASSGRGSADYDDDEEIRMINATPVRAQSRMPDSGIQPDAASIGSQTAVRSHHQYLAALGIDVGAVDRKLANNTTAAAQPATSVESMHQFSDEGGGEGDGLDMGSVSAATVQANVYGNGNFPADFSGEPVVANHTGSLSSVIDTDEELGGSYNWDYLLDWGPQYQPLAHVFTEIARLRDDSARPRVQPTTIVPQGGATPRVRTVPPPMITDAPPRVCDRRVSSGVSSRTSQLTSMSGLPKSPVSYESTFTSPALSPAFTPSLSPLARRSPSVSPAVSPVVASAMVDSSRQSTTSSNHTPRLQPRTLDSDEIHI